MEGRTIGGDWERLWLWIYQLALGLEFMHRRGIIHRDIKLENIGLDGQGNAKLLDFGSAILKWELKEQGFSLVGTPAYTAPEMITRQYLLYHAEDTMKRWTSMLWAFAFSNWSMEGEPLKEIQSKSTGDRQLSAKLGLERSVHRIWGGY